MKIFFDQTKSMTDTEGYLPKSEIRHGKLYVAYRNKEMISAPAADGYIADDDTSTNRGYNAALFTASNGSYYYNCDGLPAILLHEDEIMQYDEEISEYY